MGNCQAVDAAALVLQHPDGKIDRYYGAVSVSQVMKMYPGHYVSLIIPLPETNIPATASSDDEKSQRVVRFTRVKLLRPTETLVLGHAYRLITSQEVMKVLRAKKHAKTKRHQRETTLKKQPDQKRVPEESEDSDKDLLETKQERQPPVLTSSASSKSRTWRPSLQSISEAAS
ncbi:PREDICTED: uncharacterized protein LOC104823664 [Tarenaya hassleriana]|uniref:uncharacterized protein LOC104823664 n=1 Tax=Tarenaya hassleriana TaxID=28532 RepID=UPI00053C4852|nr:PREDICTED: uncharacterized protein LOC104823664 [Tarenaya hassleriana]